MEQLQKFLEQRPAIRLQYEQEGNFGDYSRHLRGRIPRIRGTRLINKIIEWAHARPELGVIDGLLRSQLQRYPLVSTADHCGVLNYSILYNANLLFSAFLEREALDYHVVLASSRIPLNNASHPRGVIFGNSKHHFFHKTLQRVPVYLLNQGIGHGRPGGEPWDLGHIFRPESLGRISPQQRNFLSELFLDTIDIPTIVSKRQRFLDQIPLINARLWPLYFDTEARKTKPSLLYIPTEDLVIDMVAEDLSNPQSWLHKILFIPEVRDIYLEEGQNITGCWGPGMGTQFFWGVDGQNNLIPLVVNQEGTYLVPRINTSLAPIPLNPDTLIEALANKQLLPSLFTEMFILTFQEGFTLLGGFNQVTYLAWMRVAHERAMLRLADWPQAAQYAQVLTDGLICGPLAFPQWESGLDLLWEHNSKDGEFIRGFTGGLRRQDMDEILKTPLKTLIERGISAMLQVIE